MENVLLMLTFAFFLYLASASDNNADLKTFPSGISDLVSGQNKSIPAWCYGEWIILVSYLGYVIIYNPSSYEEKIGYHAPELYGKNIGILNREFYSVDKKGGIIRSTSIEQIMAPPIDKNGKADIKWKDVGLFPAAKEYNLHRVAFKGNTMYFVTSDGTFYSYNITSKEVHHRFNLPGYDNHASLLMFDDVLYIYRINSFYTYDGHLIKVLKTPGLILPATTVKPRVYLDIFVFRTTICTVGWDGHETQIPKYPVYCWDPRKENSKWQILNYSYEARAKPAVTSTSKGTFVVGGARKPNGQPWRFIQSIEMLDHKTLNWSFVPNTPTMKPEYYSAVTFNCDRSISNDN